MNNQKVQAACPDYSDYPYIRVASPTESAGTISISDDDFLDHAGKIVFRVNRFNIFTNDSLLHQLESEVLPLINRDSLRLARLILRGAASPEGPYLNNVMLSKRRADTLVQFLRDRLTVPVDESAFRVETVAEDYSLLCAMMRRAGDPDTRLVEKIVYQYLSNNQIDLLKQRLKRQQQGRLWRRLLRKYFPELRTTRLILVFERPFGIADTTSVVMAQTPIRTPDIVVPVWRERIPRRELLSVKTNLLFDFAYMPAGYDRWCPIPNIALEYYPKGGHFTYGASIDFPWWQHYWEHKYFEVRNYQLETRYYFRSGDISKNPPGRGAAFRGWYLQAYAHAGIFLFCFNADKGWTGEAIGGGLGFGYVLPLSKRGHWRLEFGAQFGFIRAQYDPFQFEYRGSVDLQDHLYYYDWVLPAHQFKKRQYRFNWFGPTRIGITLTYDLLYRRQSKRGVSLYPYEPAERRVAE